MGCSRSESCLGGNIVRWCVLSMRAAKDRFLVPTPEGPAALALSGFLFLLATNLMAGWLFFLVAFLVALLLVGGVTALRGVRHLRVEVGPVLPAVEGGMVALPVLVQSSRTLRFVRLAAVVGGQRGETFLPVVERGTKRQSPVRLAAPARGVYALGEIRLISPGLIGMFRAERRLPARAEGGVRPPYQGVNDPPLGGSGHGGAGGGGGPPAAPPLSQALGRLNAHLRETVPVVVSSRPGPLRLSVVLVAPAGSATAWEYDGNGAVRCAAS